MMFKSTGPKGRAKERVTALSSLAASLMMGIALSAVAVASVEAAPRAKSSAAAKVSTAPLPKLVQKDGRHALMVDGAPFFILGGQANNSSNYPAMLPKVWPAIADMNANTLVMPVAWEQIEPKEGQFDFSFVDTLVKQARENKVRLVILWFGTWKNTGPSYTPDWVKLDNKRFPRLSNKDGTTSYALSPHYEATLKADKKAYVELVKHIKAIDGDQHTVIMLQIENEVGVYRSVRDYSPKATALLNGPVPDVLLKKMNKSAGTWTQVFGTDADEFFHAWHMASYMEDIAKAGKAILPLPTYVNAALKEPINPQTPGSYASGGPTHNVIDIYKAAAPNIDLLAPDIYMGDSTRYEAVLKHYARADNALFVAESGNKETYARYIFTVLGNQGIGVDPFGFDYTGYSNYPLGAPNWGPESVKPFGKLYGLFAPMQREWAKWSFEGKVRGVSEPDDHSAQTLDLGSKWSAKVTYRQWQFGMPEWDPQNKNGYPEGSDIPSGGIATAQLSDNEFLVTGHNARISFDLGPDQKGRGMILDRVEEGSFINGKWVMTRVWNGDQTDYGLNFTDKPVVLKVRLGSYEN